MSAFAGWAFGAGGIASMLGTGLNRRHRPQSPTGKMEDARDIAYAVLFLTTDEARYVNNVVLPVGGGLSSRLA